MPRSTPCAPSRILDEPKNSRSLDKREQIIILQGAKLHGCIYKPWSPDETTLGPLVNGALPLVSDQDCVSFSKLEGKDIKEWHRVDEITRLKNIGPTEVRQSVFEVPKDLAQGTASDCSVVASLCAIIARHERGHHDILQQLWHPWNGKDALPGRSSSGFYVFRFFFNGIYRQVIIDDRLPVAVSNVSLYTADRRNQSILWPALIEKAYLKIRGGYDLLGSNSALDISCLAGWLPEQVFLQREDFDRDAWWKRIFQAFQFGDVLVTIGTRVSMTSAIRNNDLVEGHNYAVVDLENVGGRRLCKLKDPWAGGSVPAASLSQEHHGVRLQSSSDDRPFASADFSDEPSRQSGTFWVDFDTETRNFESIYLNWNPALFKYRQDAHFTWEIIQNTRVDKCFRSCPQYSVTCPQGGAIWVLLGKHFRDRVSIKDGTALEEKHHLISQRNPEHGFLKLSASSTVNGERVSSSKHFTATTHFVDSPYSLIKLDANPRAVYTIVLAQQSLPLSMHAFTLSTFSLNPIIIESARDKYTHEVSRTGRWSSLSAGGHTGSKDYLTNPQYLLEISQHSSVRLVLEVHDESMQINCKLTRWPLSDCNRSLSTRDIVSDSGAYEGSAALVEELDIEPGRYCIICSTFDSGQCGVFQLHVAATNPFTIDRLSPILNGTYASIEELVVFPADVRSITLPIRSHRLNKVSIYAESIYDGSVHTRSQPSSLQLKMHTAHEEGNLDTVCSAFNALNLDDGHAKQGDKAMLRNVMVGELSMLTIARSMSESHFFREEVQLKISGEEKINVLEPVSMEYNTN